MPIVHAEEPPKEIPLESPEERERFARETARRYGIDEASFVRTLSCESIGFTWNDQSLVKDPKGPNGRENSWGIPQFYMPSSLKNALGEEITKEMALDPRKAIDAAAFNFSIGNAERWSCY